MWHFRKKTAGEKIRNPIQGEFFATDAINGPAQALVRESIQNSLDAAAGKAPVHVQFTLMTGGDALASASVTEIFGDAWPHYAATGNGLRDAPTSSSNCEYLVIEDYGTKGLTGNPAQADPDPDPTIKNPYYLFFRAEGLSAKTGTDLGRWGIGKFVFPRSSRISSHFGITVRHDDGRRLLQGAATLKAHRIAGEIAMYTPDGLYGNAAPDDLILPIEDKRAIDAFCALFGVNRTDEPGLSVVVPFVDPDISFDELLMAAAKDYFFPVLMAKLEISIVAGNKSALIKNDTLDSIIVEYENVLGRNFTALVKLARAAAGDRSADLITLGMHDSARAAKWNDELLSETALERLSAKLRINEIASVRIPVTVRSKKTGAVASYFDVHLLHDKSSDGRPVFVREGIIISDVRGRRAREIRSLVVIEDKPLATMLGDSENPAHTQWQGDSSNFKGRYIYGKAVIDFVAASVGELIAIVNRSSEEADPSLTVDYFSIEPPEDEEDIEEGTSTKRRMEKGTDPPDPDIQIPQRPTKIRIDKCNGGFDVIPGTAPPAFPFLIQVRCAYETRMGNALKKWNLADFVLGQGGVKVSCDGAVKVSSINNNIVLLHVFGPEFRTSVSGFDTNRDLYVRAETWEMTDASSEA